MKKMVNNLVVEMTSEEVKAREAEEKAWADGATERKKGELRLSIIGKPDRQLWYNVRSKEEIDLAPST